MSNTGQPRVALYERVSTEAQAEGGYSLDGQLNELRERMEAEGRRVVAEVTDPGEKRWMSTRPGLEKIKALAFAGEIDEVWAWAWDRFGESPVPEVLSIELNEHDVRLRSLDDGGEGLGGEIMRAVAGVLSREDQRTRVRKSLMGKRSKARTGQILGAGPRPRYGFEHVLNEKGKRVGYAVNEREMVVVRLIFAMLDAGESIYAVQEALKQNDTDAPRGGKQWSRATIRDIVREDVYLPHTSAELSALAQGGQMSEKVFSNLNPARSYGVYYYGKTKTSYRSNHSKRRKAEPVPREQWLAIPIDLTDSSLERGRVERARRAIEHNRVSANVGDRFWELSRGFLYCADCGRAMTSYVRRHPERGTMYPYYRCDPRNLPRGVDKPCPNRKSHPADALEIDAVRLFEEYANRGMLLELYDQAVEEQNQRIGLRDNLERRTALVERLSELDQERKGYLRQNARRVLPDGDLDAMLSEIEEQRQSITAQLRDTEDAETVAQRMQATRYALVHGEWYEDPDAVHPSEYLSLAASEEEIRRAYRRFGARFEIGMDQELKLRLNLSLAGESLHTKSSYL